MTTKRFERTPSPQTVSWFLDLADAGRLNLDPPYQRRSVWSSQYRRFFIDSVLRNYPTQSIFIDRVVDPDRPTEYRVLDGKQRLTTILLFVRNEFAAPDSLEDMGLAGKYYEDFPKEDKLRILEYLFTVEMVTNTTSAELNQAFDRLNRNVARLNKQELRHAQFDGAFIRKVEELAEDSFWEQIGLVTDARRRRMLDVEYVSEFYIVAAAGIQDGKDYLDEKYAAWDEEIPEARRVNKRFADTLAYLVELDKFLPLASTRFSNVADFYSLWSALIDLRDRDALPGASVTAGRLSEFAAELERGESERAVQYVLSARQGSNKAANRTARAKTLAQVMSQPA
ncbi:hypothetical protein BOH66_15325 [Microbacterium aurum]|uniref:GmrSD restriction endonucleases N-terminal domain-containing protein n=1 Tax=Microbacterium aurum TaxID=36805 RepID=A0A1P8UBG6_9MICO|nr:DUF262 domain-containing protein [Microbacterium aurum]APZ35457.1 hypothetical protein BOH66_15325 [Microbacterium aurum]MBM7826130.1 uncharacterized protein with ParB-like and HNH nuclease domain [Microbacterium aurum]